MVIRGANFRVKGDGDRFLSQVGQKATRSCGALYQVVANSKGGNTLVELTPSGTVLDTKVVDKSKTAGVFGIVSKGTSDNNTTLFYADTNDNNLHELEP